MKLALIGNQNSGKTSLFNALTGANQKVGNWPGVTIDRVEGQIKKYNSTIVDLPGVYSLSPYTSEEEVSRRFIIEEDVDVLINIVDATSLERSLYLTTQLLELDLDVVIALNMYDLVKKKGIHIDIKKLEEELGCTIIPISAKTKDGLDKLQETIFLKKYKKNNHKKIYPNDVENFIEDVSEFYKKINKRHFNKHIRFSAVKILEEDRDYKILMSTQLEDKHKALETKYEMDGEQLIASLRYNYIEKIRSKTVKYTPKEESKSDKLDKIFLHKYLAIPIFILIMAVVYMISIGLIGGLTSDLITALFNGGEDVEFNVIFYSWTSKLNIKGLGPLICESLSSIGASTWALSLINNGVISGISAVLSFLPQLIVLFLFLALLETTGYMSRISFFLDRVFHKFGLSGKSLIPFIVGAGCSVPGIMSSRTIEDENERNATIALVPFIPCNAKLPIISLISSAFFKKWGFAFALLFYFMSIVIIVLMSLLIKKIFFKKQHSTFISELPEYKTPNIRYIGRDVWDKTFAFIKRAGTVVLFFSIIVWFLSSFTWDFKYVTGVEINRSMLAGIGNSIAWFFYPMLGCNWSWGASVSILQGLIAKEQVISSMQIIANKSSGGMETFIFASEAFKFFTPITAFSFTAFNLFSIPCVGSLSTMKAEFKSWKKLGLAILLEIAVAWIIATSIGIWGIKL